MSLDYEEIKRLFDQKEYSKILDLVTTEDTVEAKYFQFRCLFFLTKLNEAHTVLVDNETLFNKNNYWKAVFLCNYGMILFYLGEYDIIPDYFNKALNLIQNLQENNKDTPIVSKNGLLAKINQNIGIFQINMGNYNTSLEYIFKALEISKTEKDEQGIMICYKFLGIISGLRGQYEKTEQYFIEGLTIAQNNDWKADIANFYGNIAFLYGEKKNYEEALKFELKTMDILEKLKQELYDLKAVAYSNAVDYYFNLGDIENSKKYLEKLRILAQKSIIPMVKEMYLLTKAIHFKNSKRSLQRAEGEKLLREFINKPSLRKDMKIQAIENLLDLLLIEFQSTREMEVFDEFKKYVKELSELAQKQHLPANLIHILILEAKLESIEGRYNNAEDCIKQAFEIASENEMTDFLDLINTEKIGIEKEFKKMQQILQENENINNLLTNNEVMAYLTKALKLVR